MEKYIYGAERFPVGTRVRVKGSRDVHSGKVGEVVRPDGRYNFWVKIADGLYRKSGRTLVAISLPERAEPEKLPRENLTKEFDVAYRKMKAKDSRFARSIKGFVW